MPARAVRLFAFAGVLAVTLGAGFLAVRVPVTRPESTAPVAPERDGQTSASAGARMAAEPDVLTPEPGRKFLSRTESRRALAECVAHLTAQAVALSAEAVLDFDFEPSVTPRERALLAALRDGAYRRGELFLAARRGDGSIATYAKPPFPRGLFRAEIAASLTEADWTEFQWAWAVAQFRLLEDRREHHQQIRARAKAALMDK